jgi:hypothetical protein
MMEGIEQPNPYKELRKELALLYQQIGRTLNKMDLILKKLEMETR